MKRDFEVIRNLLQQIEKSEIATFKSENVNEAFQLALMIDADFIDGVIECDSTGFPIRVKAIRLKWKGCEFLDSVRNDTVWEKIKSRLKGRILDVPGDVLLSLAKHVLGCGLGLA